MNKYLDFAEKLKDIIGADRVMQDEPMKSHTYFRLGGPADIMVSPGTVEELKQVLQLAKQEAISVDELEKYHTRIIDKKVVLVINRKEKGNWFLQDQDNGWGLLPYDSSAEDLIAIIIAVNRGMVVLPVGELRRVITKDDSGAEREIEGMIERIQSDTRNMISAMNSSLSEVEAGSQLANEAGAAISQIHDGASKVVEVVNELNRVVVD